MTGISLETQAGNYYSLGSETSLREPIRTILEMRVFTISRVFYVKLLRVILYIIFLFEEFGDHVGATFLDSLCRHSVS